MKKSCETDSIDIFEGQLADINKNNNTKNTDSDLVGVHKYFWTPNTSVNKIIENYCLSNKFVKNLEIGPGFAPFTLATDFIGSNEKITNYIEIDIDYQKIPFNDDSIDFIYCRHVLEDIQNPDFAFNEMVRVSKFGGYIETPSPLIEITKNVDALEFSSKYCGYIHHRYIVWSSIEKNEIYFLPKYSCILDNCLEYSHETNQQIFHLINNYSIYWNNHFIFTSEQKPNIIMYKNGVNFNIKESDMVSDYLALVNRAVNECIQNTNYFVNNYKSFLDK